MSVELLAATGITVTVHGPSGQLATLGAGASNRFGRAVTGSSRAAPVRRAALRQVWASTPLRMAAFAVPVALIVLVAIRSLQRTVQHRSRTGGQG